VRAKRQAVGRVTAGPHARSRAMSPVLREVERQGERRGEHEARAGRSERERAGACAAAPEPRRGRLDGDGRRHIVDHIVGRFYGGGAHASFTRASVDSGGERRGRRAACGSGRGRSGRRCCPTTRRLAVIGNGVANEKDKRVVRDARRGVLKANLETRRGPVSAAYCPRRQTCSAAEARSAPRSLEVRGTRRLAGSARRPPG
jgi:hypothetical protein